MFTLEARITKEAKFTEKELLMLINASLASDCNDPVVQDACELLYEKFRGSGYISGSWIQDAAYEYDKEKYNIGGFDDIEF